MAEDLPADLLLHPVRLRVVQALAHRPLTTAGLQEVLGDVPQATLYRHVSTLEASGLLEVVATRRVRGGTERTLAVTRGAASLAAGDVAGASAADHLRWFTVFAGTLLADMAAYLAHAGDDPDLADDRVGYRQVPLWLDDDELDELAAELRDAVRARLDLPARPGRRRRLLTTVVLPDDRATAVDAT